MPRLEAIDSEMLKSNIWTNVGRKLHYVSEEKSGSCTKYGNGTKTNTTSIPDQLPIATWKDNEKGLFSGDRGRVRTSIYWDRYTYIKVWLALLCFLGGGGLVMDDIKQNRAFAFGASWVFFCKHDIHETPGAPHKHHGYGLRAGGVLPGLLLVHFRWYTWTRRRCRRSTRGLRMEVSSCWWWQIQPEIKLWYVSSAHDSPRIPLIFSWNHISWNIL